RRRTPREIRACVKGDAVAPFNGQQNRFDESRRRTCALRSSPPANWPPIPLTTKKKQSFYIGRRLGLVNAFQPRTVSGSTACKTTTGATRGDFSDEGIWPMHPRAV